MGTRSPSHSGASNKSRIKSVSLELRCLSASDETASNVVLKLETTDVACISRAKVSFRSWKASATGGMTQAILPRLNVPLHAPKIRHATFSHTTHTPFSLHT